METSQLTATQTTEATILADAEVEFERLFRLDCTERPGRANALVGGICLIRILFQRTANDESALEHILFWHLHQPPEVAGCVFELLPKKIPASADVKKIFAAIRRYYEAESKENPKWEGIECQLNSMLCVNSVTSFCRTYYLIRCVQKMEKANQHEQLNELFLNLTFKNSETGSRQDLQSALISQMEADQWYSIDIARSYRAYNAALVSYRAMKEETGLARDDQRLIGVVTMYWALIQSADQLYPVGSRLEPLNVTLEDRQWCVMLFPNVCRIN